MGGTSASHHDHNDAVESFLKSRGYRGLFVQMEVRVLYPLLAYLIRFPNFYSFFALLLLFLFLV